MRRTISSEASIWYQEDKFLMRQESEQLRQSQQFLSPFLLLVSSSFPSQILSQLSLRHPEKVFELVPEGGLAFAASSLYFLEVSPANSDCVRSCVLRHPVF